MRRRLLAISVLVLILSSVLVFAGTASAHTGQVVSADCTQVSASFSEFAAADHPISFQVSVLGGPFQTVAAVESPPSFAGAGTATADISSLTAVLQGAPGSVAVFAEWNAGRTDTATFTVTCGTPPPPSTTTPPPTTTTPPPTTTTQPPPPPPTAQPPSPPIQSVSAAPPPATPPAVNPATAG